MKVKFILIIVCLLTFIVSSCGSRTEAQKQCQIKVGIVFDIGGKNDRSFNAAAWDGVKRAEKDLPICLYDVEPGNPTSIEPAMRAFAEKNFDLIIGVGFAQGPIMQKVAEDYPNIKFGIVDGVITGKDGKPLPNVASLGFPRTRRLFSRRNDRRLEIENRNFGFCRRNGHSFDSQI